MDEGLERLRGRSIGKLDPESALTHLATLIDASSDAGFARGLDRALRQLDELQARDLTAPQAALAEYYRANVWSGKGALAGGARSWSWEQPERQEELLALSRAVTHAGFAELDRTRQCQILTNRANLLNSVGRFIDALESWDAALRVIPRFAMARGNRASGLRYYAQALYDPGHQGLFFLHAYEAAVSATADDAIFDCAYPPAVPAGFNELARGIASHVPLDAIRATADLDGFSLGRGKAERAYRRWCLAERLFLNPLNDLGPYAIAARDALMLPSLTIEREPSKSGLGMPPIIGLFNQLKQEYVAARFHLYEGLTMSGVHFADRGVLLYNTLDYPTYSLAMERVRTSYRIAYSILDKISYLINHFWNLGNDPERVSFRTVWLGEGAGKPKHLVTRFSTYENWPMRGLFWLSKEIFDPDLSLTTNPNARELHEIRNHLEHKYLQAHEGWARSALEREPTDSALAKPITSDDLEAKALRVVKIARSALIYTCLAVAREERIRERAKLPGLSAPMLLTTWDDSWKRSR